MDILYVIFLSVFSLVVLFSSDKINRLSTNVRDEHVLTILVVSQLVRLLLKWLQLLIQVF